MNARDVKNRGKIVKVFGLLVAVMVVTSPVTHHTVYAAKAESATMNNTSKTVKAVNTKLELTQEDLVIAGLTQAMNKEKMIALLGTATTTEKFTVDYFAGGKNVKFTKYNYPGVSVTVVDINGRIIEIETTDTTYKTARGVRIGDPIAKVKKLYGDEDLHSPSRIGQPFYVYVKAKSPEVLSFKVDPLTKKVIKISVDSWSN